MRIAIEGGRLIDPAARLDRMGGVYVADGRIVGVGEAPTGFAADRRVDARAQIVARA